jgi:hypothetical protein
MEMILDKEKHLIELESKVVNKRLKKRYTGKNKNRHNPTARFNWHMFIKMIKLF